MKTTATTSKSSPARSGARATASTGSPISGLDALSELSVEKPATKADTAKINVKVEDAETKGAITGLISVREKMKVLKGEEKIHADIIKTRGQEINTKNAEDTGEVNRSFLLVTDEKPEGLMHITQDNYIKSNIDVAHLNEKYAKVKELGILGQDQFGNNKGITSKETKFIITEDMAIKYGAKLAVFIKENIEVADQKKILVRDTKETITKGVIGKLRDISKACDVPVAAILQEVQPIRQLKVRGDEEAEA